VESGRAQLDLGGLEDEHFHLVGRQGERIVQSFEEPHLHDADLIGGIAEGIGHPGVGDGSGVVPELHGNQGTCEK